MIDVRTDRTRAWSKAARHAVQIVSMQYLFLPPNREDGQREDS